MATRHIRRLQQLQNDPAPKHAESDDEEDDIKPDIPTIPRPFNPFDLLSDDEEEAKPEQEEEEVKEQPRAAQSATSQGGKQLVKSGAAAGKSKKGKKKKGGKKDVQGTEDAAPQKSEALEENLDALLQELNISLDEEAATARATSSTATTRPPVLALESSSLRGDEELRGIFGADVVDVVEREEQRDAARHGRRPRGVPGGQRPSLRKYLLSTPKDYWPPYQGTLTMELTGTKDGCQVFRYVHTPSYAEAQRLFEESQATMDPNAIMAVLRMHPFHVDALLTMYELYHHMGENQDADEVLHRALFALETAWHPRFVPASSMCRLEFGVKENRALSVAVFRHMQRLSRSGCHNTALECCKMLLAIDPEDPLGCLQYIDYLALRAGKYSFLQRLASEFPGNTSLPLLPNFAYSIALSRFHQQAQRAPSASESKAGGGGKAGRSRRNLSRGGNQGNASTSYEERDALELLVEALLLHPLVLKELMECLRQAGVNLDAYWSSTLRHKLFVSASDGGSTSLAHLVRIYVERNHLLWKVPDVLAWLKAGAARAVEVADGKADWEGPSATDWECVRNDAFPPSDTNEYNHLRTHEFSDSVNSLPREEVQAAMAAGDIMEVEGALAALQAQARVELQRAQQAGAGPRIRVTQEQLQNGSPLAMLLYSLLPWVDAGQQAGDSQEEAARQPPGGGAGQG